MQEHNLNVQDLQTPQMPSFQGISGQFFQSASTYINYAVPVNSQITRTPQNKAQAAKMQAIVRKIKSPSGHAARIGNSMARSGIQESVLMDQTANNGTVLREYGVQIMREMMKTDISYHKGLLYGDPGYLRRQQSGERMISGGLSGGSVGFSTSGGQEGSRSGSGRISGYGYTRAGSSGVGRTGSSGPGGTSRPFRAQAAAPVSQAEQLQQKDVLKGVDYIFQVVFKESYSLETQFFASSLFHRVLSRLQVRKSEIKLLAGACVFVATKHEENYGEALGASAVCAYFGGAFTVQQLLRAELRLLDALEWRLGVSATNARGYLRTLFRDLGVGLHLSILSTFLAELTLLDQRFLKYTAFEVALAAIELAVLSAAIQPLGVDNSKSVLQKLFLATASANSQSAKCRDELNSFWGDIVKNGTVTQVYKKYATESYFAVSKRPNIQGNIDEIVDRQLGKI